MQRCATLAAASCTALIVCRMLSDAADTGSPMISAPLSLIAEASCGLLLSLRASCPCMWQIWGGNCVGRELRHKLIALISGRTSSEV